MEYVDVLGVKISKVDYQSAIRIIEGFLADGGKHYVVTPNPEFVVLAQSDDEFRQILNRADLAVPDGVGLRVGTRVTGTDLMIGLCGLASQRGYSVFLLGGRGGVAEAAAERLKAQFANLNIVGTCEGDPEEDFSEQLRKLSESDGQRVRESDSPEIRSTGVSDSPIHRSTDAPSYSEFSGIDLLFVAYGAPKQEKWIAQNLSKIPVRVAMGVGGAFDFIAGRKKRAPKILRRLGLEWFWRLIQEPQRLPRIFNATVKFPLLVFLHKFKAPVKVRG